MKNKTEGIKSKLIRLLIGIVSVFVAVILALSFANMQISNRDKARIDADEMFHQVERILKENEKELNYTVEEYRKTCISNAHSIAYMLQYNPKVIDDVKKLKEIAVMSQVDEIHIFDKEGTIVKGTNPEYYGMNFDSGEQMQFFKPMLENKDLELVQDITPNTAEDKPMQYSAVWSEDHSFILQIGMEPVNVTRLTEHNELSYVFSLLNTGSGVTMLAFDSATGQIMGTTNDKLMGQNIRDIGISPQEVKDGASAILANVDGMETLCYFKSRDQIRLGYLVSESRVYRDIKSSMFRQALSLILVSTLLIFAVVWCLDRYVIHAIRDINADLTEILEGNLQKKVQIEGSSEFLELSDHVNDTIGVILESTRKMSYVLNQVNTNIGVYEYNNLMKSVRFTDRIPEILDIDGETAQKLEADHTLFEKYLSDIKKHALEGEEGVYVLEGSHTRYLRIEEQKQGNDIFGIVLDMTAEVEKRLLAEADRDIDLLTGIYNRRGVNGNLAKLFEDPESLGEGAILLVDADGLKEINDQYGHEYGDLYLKTIADYLNTFGVEKNISGRLGGDEYVMFLYGYATQEKLFKDLDRLRKLQDGNFVDTEGGIRLPIRFSMGYVLSKGENDYHKLMRQADEKMYLNKKERKAGR